MPSLDALRRDLQALVRAHARLLSHGPLAVQGGVLRHVPRKGAAPTDLAPSSLLDCRLNGVAAPVEDTHGDLTPLVGPPTARASSGTGPLAAPSSPS